MADGASLSNRGARPLDAARVAGVRETLDPTADFAETARRALLDLIARFDPVIRDADLTACAADLARMRAHLAALSPAALTPRGWFDSRARRLKRFRRLFLPARHDAIRVQADLDQACRNAAQRSGALVALWNETRDAVAALDAHVAAGRDRLAERPEDERLTGFRRRLAELEAPLPAAVRRLPLALAAQNADLTARDRLRACAEALSAWTADWTPALGLEGRKPRRVAVTPAALTEGRDRLIDALAAAERDLASALARRAEILARLERLSPPD